MNSKFPTLILGWALLAAPGPAAAQPPDSAAATNPDAPPLTTAGQPLVAQAAQQLLQYPSLDARIRQRTDLFGQQLVGSGSYRQLGEQPEKLLRLELKLQVADQVTSMQQVCDGRFLWSRHDLGQQQTLTRVDLRRIRQAAEAAGGAPGVAPAGTWMALGGLPRLLEALHENFRFGTARPGQLGQVPVWVLQGHWKAEKLAQLLPDQQDEILAGRPAKLDRLARHLPDSVRLVLGRDPMLPLFPYRIEYRRNGNEANKEPSSSPARTLVMLELFEVRQGAELDPRQFVYQAGDQAVVDQTELYLQNLGLVTAP